MPETVSVSRKPEKNKFCIEKIEGKRKKYYCVDKKEFREYLYDIIYMQENNINLAVRIIPQKNKFLEYAIFQDRIQITEKELIATEDPESYVSAEYLGEPMVIIKESLNHFKKLYGLPWYKNPKLIGITITSIAIIGLGIFYYTKSHKTTPISKAPSKPLPPPVGKTLSLAQKQKIQEGLTKDALYNIAYAIEQTTSIGLPTYISEITYELKDEKPTSGKDESITGNLSITLRFGYPANGSKLISTKPIPIYSKVINISLKPINTNSDNIDEKTCGIEFLKEGLNLYDVNTLEFKGDITDYKNFYNFIQTMYYCKGYIKSLKLTNPNDIVNNSDNHQNKNIIASIDAFLIK